jgi:hypothetical protein
MLDLLLLTEWVTRMKLGSNSVEDHPQQSHNRHPVDGALVCAGPCGPLNGSLLSSTRAHSFTVCALCHLLGLGVRNSIKYA